MWAENRHPWTKTSGLSDGGGARKQTHEHLFANSCFSCNLYLCSFHSNTSGSFYKTWWKAGEASSAWKGNVYRYGSAAQGIRLQDKTNSVDCGYENTRRYICSRLRRWNVYLCRWMWVLQQARINWKGLHRCIVERMRGLSLYLGFITLPVLFVINVQFSLSCYQVIFSDIRWNKLGVGCRCFYIRDEIKIL